MMSSTSRQLGLGLIALFVCGCLVVLCHGLGCKEKTAAGTPPTDNDSGWESDRIKLAPGEAAPDFRLRDLDGVDFRLHDAFGKRPVVIEFGSYT